MAKLRICTGCQQLTKNTNRCATCGPKQQPAHHTGQDRQQMRAIVAQAQQNPNTICWLCGNRDPPPGYNPKWTADHENAGQPGSRLHPAHLGCNTARGNRTPHQFREYLKTRPK